jgi:hypothetical protein
VLAVGDAPSRNQPQKALLGRFVQRALFEGASGAKPAADLIFGGPAHFKFHRKKSAGLAQGGSVEAAAQPRALRGGSPFAKQQRAIEREVAYAGDHGAVVGHQQRIEHQDAARREAAAMFHGTFSNLNLRGKRSAAQSLPWGRLVRKSNRGAGVQLVVETRYDEAMASQDNQAWLASLDDQAIEAFVAIHPQAALTRSLLGWSHADKATRMGAAKLAAWALCNPSSALGKRASTGDTLAFFLKPCDEAALEFLRRAKKLIKAERAQWIPKLESHHLEWVDQAAPGLVASSAPSLWGGAPEWCAKMRRSGRLNGAGVLACVAAAIRARERADILPKGAPLREPARRFALRAEAADPGWGRAAWDAYFALDVDPNDLDEDGAEQALAWRCADYSSFVSGVDPFESLDAKKLNDKTAWLLDKMAWLMRDNVGMARQLGRFLADAPAWAIPARSEEGRPACLMVELANKEMGRLVALNDSAKALGALAWLDEGRAVAPCADTPEGKQGSAWLALAEGLASAGAEPPRFEFHWAASAVASPESAPHCLQGSSLTMLALADALPGADRSTLLGWALSGADETDMAAWSSAVEILGRRATVDQRLAWDELRKDLERGALEKAATPAALNATSLRL